MNQLLSSVFLVLVVGIATARAEGPKPDPAEDKAAFEKAAAGGWREVFADPGSGDWKEKWFLDGAIGTVKNTERGMELTAGPEFKNDAHHMVLWTKDSFRGDIRISYDYTRLDQSPNCVTILYIQATGSGQGPYAKDITEWNHLRKVPAMNLYFDHMHTYHISYAAAPGTDESYIRGRRYLPEGKGLKGTELKPDYFPERLFQTGVPHKITVIKNARGLFLRVENAEQTLHCHMRQPGLPEISEGRIGLRHMFTRSARYANVRVSVPEK